MLRLLGCVQLPRLMSRGEIDGTLMSTHRTTYLTIMFPTPQNCPCGIPHRVFLPHLSPLCLRHHPAHLLRSANSPDPAIPFGIFHQPVNDFSQGTCTMWQVPSLTRQLYSGLSWSGHCWPELGIFPMGTTASHYPGPGPSSARTFFPDWAVGEAEGQLSFGEAICCSSPLGLEVPVGRL